MGRKEKLKVLQLGSPTGLYGAERWILALTSHLDRQRVDSTVAVIRDDVSLAAPLCVEADRLGIKTLVFEAEGRVNFSAVSRLRAYIRDKGVDILHTHAYKQDIIGLLASIGTSCKCVSTPHGWSREADLKLWCYERLNRAIFPFFDAVVPLSDELYRPLLRIPGLKKRLHLIRNGVDLTEIEAATACVSRLRRWNQQGIFVIGYIGQLIGRKGLDVLLEAVGSLPHDLDWRLVIIGEGEKKRSLMEQAETMEHGDRVSFPGFRPDRLRWLNGFDCFVLPSQLEGIPRCLMEAMAAGVAVVATDIPGCTDLIDHQGTGLLFPVGDGSALTAALEKLAADGAGRRKLAHRGREYVRQRYSAGRMAREYEKLYFSL